MASLFYLKALLLQKIQKNEKQPYTHTFCPMELGDMPQNNPISIFFI